ncbi:Peptidyl-prolyl cis-trans isomerase [Microbotryomycetes sp. JL221]|nr:Peptidyl-prolyl cis-trans isomerase [Microbotryomycetes sp. JL221]
MVNPRVFFDISVEGQLLGRIIFELFADRVPKTAENFRALCTGSAGVNSSGVPLWYKGSIFHRVIAGFMIQGGDFTLRNGKGGESIYGGTFADEDLKREIDAEGLLCMANRGKDTNGSQFFVSLRPCPHLKGKHVVFGRVVKGFEIVEAMSKLGVDAKDHPLQLITISHCGELERREEQIAVLREQVKRDEEAASRRAEEAERDRKRKQREADELKREHALKSGDGVVYKGRGRMKAPSLGGMRGWS